jgi:eukaryotic-like serine/threonine-protein kinase
VHEARIAETLSPYPSFSPDGRWLAYASTEAGATEVFVRAFPQPASASGGRWQISMNGGTAPVWSRSGRGLLYQSGDRILAASYAVTGNTFVRGKPRVWAATRVAPGRPNTRAWDLAPDGKRVAVAPSAPRLDRKCWTRVRVTTERRRQCEQPDWNKRPTSG